MQSPGTSITGVTILTSMSESDVSQVGFRAPALDSAVALAKVAVSAGARAIVCSPLEISAVRSEIGGTPIIITPGVRPLEMVGSDDQQRTMTPEAAIKAGANLGCHRASDHTELGARCWGNERARPGDWLTPNLISTRFSPWERRHN
jgi:orotidine-5'-phosphate decarboxylase